MLCIRRRVLVCFLMGIFSFRSRSLAQTHNHTGSLAAAIDSSRTVRMSGTLHPYAQSLYDRGPLPEDYRLPYITLLLKPSESQQAALARLLAEQQNPASKRYHRWLSPEQYAERFGAPVADYEKICDWLRSEGFTIVQKSRGRNWVAFSAAATQVQTALHTEIHNYVLHGTSYFANATEASVPEDLRDRIVGLRGLNNFRTRPTAQNISHLNISHLNQAPRARPNFTNITTNPDGSQTVTHFLAPDDVATIYDMLPLYQAGVDGSGQTLAIVGDSDITLSDIQQFRAGFNLPANDPQVVLVPGSPDPGHIADEAEVDLQLEWAGAVARNANLLYVISDASAGGVLNAAQHVIDNNLAPVISMPFAGCEQLVGGSAIAGFEIELQKANAEGITILSAAGNTGAAACDEADPLATGLATHGLSVNYPASSPEVTGVGGTDFKEGTGLYWAVVNSANQGSALSYIPEVAWNDAKPSVGLSASGGGASSCATGSAASCSGGFPKPSWQSGVGGIPADGVRDVPDLAFAASAAHDGFMVCALDSCAQGFPGPTVGGGTEAATSLFAGIMTLVNQYFVAHGIQQTPGVGNINPALYQLLWKNPNSTSGSIFHDVQKGNNVVPCAPGTVSCPPVIPYQIGYSAAKAYDQVTGLGSLDASNFATVLGALSGGNVNQSITTLSITSTVDSSPVQQATPGTPLAFTVIAQGMINGALQDGTVTLFSGATPFATGPIDPSFSPPSAIITATPPDGTTSVTAVYSGDATFSGSTSVPAVLFVADFAISSTVSTFDIKRGTNAFIPITVTPSIPTYGPTIVFGCYGLPSEATCSFSPATVPGTGGPVTTTMAIITAAPTASFHYDFGSKWKLFYALLFPGVVGVLLVPVRRLHKKRLSVVGSVGLLLLAIGLWTGCGNSKTVVDPGTQPTGMRQFSVTASANGQIQHTLTLTMNIQ
jgi:hypothetical protein